ncbi:MAG: hypothetical protein ACPGJV_03310 [Bacteriovoracaceae bacterium]
MASCGSFRSQEAIIQVTNKSYQSEFKDEFGYTGETPSFYKMRAARKQKLYLVDEESEVLKTYQYRCSYNFRDSIIPNLIPAVFFPVGTILSGVFFSVDGWNGSLYRCHKKLDLDFKDQENYQKRVLLIPFNEEDPVLRRKILKLWKEKFSVNLKKSNYKVLNVSKPWEFLGLKGTHFTSSKKPHEFNERVLLELGYITQMTHIAYLDKEYDEKGLKVKLRIYDVFKRKYIEQNHASHHFTGVKKDSFSWKTVLLKSFTLIPNAITLSTSTRPILSEEPTLKSYEIKSHPESFPSIVQAIGFESINHPNQYNTWQAGFYFGPAIALDAWRVEGNDDASNLYRTNIEVYQLIFNGNAFWNTAFGMPTLFLGFGIAYTNVDNELNTDLGGGESSVLNFGFKHHIFLSDRYYVGVELSAHSLGEGFSGKKVLKEGPLHYDSWYKAFFKFGIYLPTLRNHISEYVY